MSVCHYPSLLDDLIMVEQVGQPAGKQEEVMKNAEIDNNNDNN